MVRVMSSSPTSKNRLFLLLPLPSLHFLSLLFLSLSFISFIFLLPSFPFFFFPFSFLFQSEQKTRMKEVSSSLLLSSPGSFENQKITERIVPRRIKLSPNISNHSNGERAKPWMIMLVILSSLLLVE